MQSTTRPPIDSPRRDCLCSQAPQDHRSTLDPKYDRLLRAWSKAVPSRMDSPNVPAAFRLLSTLVEEGQGIILSNEPICEIFTKKNRFPSAAGAMTKWRSMSP